VIAGALHRAKQPDTALDFAIVEHRLGAGTLHGARRD